MQFIIDTSDKLNIQDKELSELLTNVYVHDGFTDAEQAAMVFDPFAVRERGTLIGARDKENSILAGIVHRILLLAVWQRAMKQKCICWELNRNIANMAWEGC